MNYSIMLEAGKNVIYLAACALGGVCPNPQAIKEADLSAVFAQAKRHSMQAITYIALETYIKEYGYDGLDKETTDKWHKAYNYELKKLIMMSLERDKLLNYLESNGIWYLPLKGAVLMNWYPKLGMRQMSDNDILTDARRRKEIRKFMTENGYDVTEYGGEQPDTYSKEDRFVFEIHHKLYSEAENLKVMSDYYRNVEERLVSDGKTKYGKRFTDEDFYIYITTHAYKHFVSRGNGIRSLVDASVAEKRIGSAVFGEYVTTELKKLGIEEYRNEISQLSGKLFSENPPLPCEYETLLSKRERELVAYHTFSGTFGNLELTVSNAMLEMKKSDKVTLGTRIRYLLSRVFPNMDFYKLNFPTAYKYKILLPLCWFMRVFRGVFHIKKTVGEINIALKLDIDSDK